LFGGAWSALARAGSRWGGGGPHDPDKPDALDRRVVEQARRVGVKFLGHRDDVERVYAALDILALASHREGFPRAPMEAAAMGVPGVVTDVRGCREVVVPNVTGLLVPVADPGALREAIRALGENSERRSRYGVAARARAQQEFDERRVVDRVLDTYADTSRTRGIHLAGLGDRAPTRDTHSP
jgi:glycosyltransferase involved in cell wall biosynthesis